MSRTRSAMIGLAVLLTAGCKQDPAPPPPPPPAEDASTPPPPPPQGIGAIEAVITLGGEIPPTGTLSGGSDPHCAKKPIPDESLLVSGRSVLNAVAYLEDSPEGEHGPSGSAIGLRQDGCRYEPHVQAVQAGAKLVIENGDPTLHNVHAYKKNGSTWFNLAQPPGAPSPITKDLNEQSQLYSFRCDVHPWMKAYVLVVSHPYFAKADAAGKMLITNVPAGRHTLLVWHEKLGVTKVEVTVADGQTSRVTVQKALP